jgi:NitT/TauT family transport system permease protein
MKGLWRWTAWGLERAIVPLGLIVLWHLAVVVTGTKIFPTPLDVARGLNELPHLGAYTRDSLFRVACGYLAAVFFGVPAGLVLGLWLPA